MEIEERFRIGFNKLFGELGDWRLALARLFEVDYPIRNAIMAYFNWEGDEELYTAEVQVGERLNNLMFEVLAEHVERVAEIA